MATQLYVTIKELMEMLEISKSTAQKIIQNCNGELKARGFITISGKTPRSYLYERLGISIKK